MAAHAKHYQDKDIENKLRLLVSSQAKFDELIEFGFPIHLGPSDLAIVESGSEMQMSPLSDDLPDDLSSPGSLAHWQTQHAALEQIRESMDLTRKGDHFEDEGARYSRMSLVSNGLGSPMAAVPREMTLKFTLTPASMRADEAILYGWQKMLNASDEALEEMEDEESYSSGLGSGPAVTPGLDANVTNESGALSNSIPVGGFGKDAASSKTMMKRVFGKLKKGPKANGTSVMITSADMN